MPQPIRVLTLTEHYLPGFRGGGPIRSLANTIEALGDEFEFVVLTRDRDLGQEQPYPALSGSRIRVGKAEVRYLAPQELRPHRIWWILRREPHDVLYANSFLSRPFSMVPAFLRWLRAVPRRPFVIAPRGELTPGALSLRRTRKRTYLGLARASGLYRRVLWQATNPEEADAIRARFGPHARVRLAPIPVPGPTNDDGTGSNQREATGDGLRIAYLSR